MGKKDRYKPYWKHKIAENLARDERNFATLRGMGWVVVRVWQHDVKKNLPEVTEEIVAAVNERKNEMANP